MTIIRGTKKWIENFDRALTLTSTPEGGTGWTAIDTSSSGTPTYLTATEDGGKLDLTLSSTDEVNVVTLCQNDVLMYDARKLQHVWWIAKVGSIDNLTVLTLGVGSAQADDEDSVATNAWFKMEGVTSTTAVVVETDDATNDNSDVATGKSLAAVYQKMHIDFTNGLSDVRFFMNGDRVASATTFDMSDLTAGLNVQPYVQLSKPSGTGTPSVSIAQFGVQYETAYGA